MLALAHEECQFAEDHVPTYQYACTECDHRFEAVQSFSDEALTECPSCGGKLRKVFSSVGIVFKGSGFYRTDSRSGSSTVSPESSSSSNGSDSAPAKSDSGTKSESSSSSSKSDSTASSSTSKAAAAS